MTWKQHHGGGKNRDREVQNSIPLAKRAATSDVTYYTGASRRTSVNLRKFLITLDLPGVKRLPGTCTKEGARFMTTGLRGTLRGSARRMRY